MALSRFIVTADRWFGTKVNESGRQANRLGLTLQQANRPLLPREYMATAMATAITAGLFITVLVTALWLAIGAAVWWLMLAVILTVGGLAAVGAYAAVMAMPTLLAAERGSNIDDHLPFALDYLGNLVGPGAPFITALERVTAQSIYGEVAVEMQRIVRDVKHLGVDRTTALSAAIERSPSASFKEVLQGISTTLAAGGDMAAYLKRKSTELFEFHKVRQRKALDNLGLLSEMFVVIAVAAPLLMIIMLVAVGLFGSDGGDAVVSSGFRLFSVLVPVLYAAFTGAIMIYKPVS